MVIFEPQYIILNKNGFLLFFLLFEILFNKLLNQLMNHEKNSHNYIGKNMLIKKGKFLGCYEII